jgi:serine/threonine-protein kinase
VTHLPCPPEHWSRFSDLLDRAMDLPEASRPAWLDGLQGDDATLRPWLNRVLNSSASMSTSDFLNAPALAGEPDTAFAAGQTIGPYRLVALLGEGGMGQVWQARGGDDGPQRDVALKLPHAELLAGPFRQRFKRERDMVAGLSHPNIAALYDAGVSAEGHPYLALELIQGQPITDHCRETNATLERRVELVRQVLGALAYAHSRLIVHRDIKPSNVMVTQHGEVKLLDFGIAKLLDGTAPTEAPLTQPMARLATPGYAAPEQMDGGPVTVAADLFAAGVLLFELCTGSRPPRIGPGDGQAPLASSRAGTNFGKSGALVGIARRLRGDLDAIIAKALSFDPAERYSSADAFARDLRRWGDGLPVSARRIGWAALSAKFVRRNKVGVTLAVVLAVALIAGTTGVLWQARRAEHEAQRANAIKDYLIALFEQGDPRSGKPSATMTAKQLLDIGADRADRAFAGDPVTEMELLSALGNVYDAMSDGDRAEAAWTRNLELERKLYGAADPRSVDATLHLVATEVEFQDEDKARAQLEQIRAPIFSIYGAASLQRAQWLVGRAESLRDVHGGRQEALADALASVAILGEHFADNPSYADALETLSDYQYDSEQCAASLATMEKVRSLEVSRHEFDPMDELGYNINTAGRLACLGRLDAAEQRYLLAQRQAERQLGQQSLWYLHAVLGRAIMAHMNGDRDKAHALLESVMSQGFDKARKTGTPTSIRRGYGFILLHEGRVAEAIPILEGALAETRLHTRDEPNLRRTEALLGDAYDKVGRTAQARTLLLSARDAFLQFGNPGMPMTVAAQERWARFLLDHGDADAARAEFTAAIAQANGAPTAGAALAEAGLARVALQAADIKTAATHSARALQILDATTLAYDVRQRIDIWLIRAAVLAAMGQKNAAIAWATRALASATAWDAPASAQIARAGEVLEQVKQGPGALPPGPPLRTSP